LRKGSRVSRPGVKYMVVPFAVDYHETFIISAGSEGIISQLKRPFINI